MENKFKNWLLTKKGNKCSENLKKHGFDSHFVEDSGKAVDLILEMTKNYESFGFGGSDTTRAMGLVSMFKEMGKTVYDHSEGGFTIEKSLECRKKQSQADCFLCSANAISMTGEIINVDGVGNRTNAMTFGPKKVIVVAGINKVAPDLHSALARVKEVAGPMRAKSLGMDTPCAETGICQDCNSPRRICNITLILHRKPMLTDISVILVNKELGY